MIWQVKWGPQVPKLLQIEQATGVTPRALLDEPKLYGAAMELSRSYAILASRRTAGMGSNPIQLSEIKSYIGFYGGPTIPVDIFIDLIGVMDMKYLELSNGDRTGSNS